jgi:hypothetical protein
LLNKSGYSAYIFIIGRILIFAKVYLSLPAMHASGPERFRELSFFVCQRQAEEALFMLCCRNWK